MSLCSTFRRSAAALALLLPSLLAVPSAHAHSVALSSSSGTAFSYDLLADNGTVSFYGGSTISMDGFSGSIVSVSLSPLASLYGSVNYSDSAIVYTLNTNQFYSWPTPADLPLFTVLTNTNSLGTLYWTLNEADGSQRGSIDPATAASSTSGYPAPNVTITPLPPAYSSSNAITVLPASNSNNAQTNNAQTSNAQTNNASAYTQPAGIVATPEPSSLILLGSGLVGAASMLRRRLN